MVVINHTEYSQRYQCEPYPQRMTHKKQFCISARFDLSQESDSTVHGHDPNCGQHERDPQDILVKWMQIPQMSGKYFEEAVHVLETLDNAFESHAPFLIIAEEIKGGTCRAQEHNVTGLGTIACCLCRLVQRVYRHRIIAARP